MQHTSLAPPHFNDSLPTRAKQARWRGVGNPYTFLNEIGIIPLKERLFRGANIIDIADELNLPLTLIHQWITDNNYTEDFEQASRISAEGYIHQGEQMLKLATNKFELDKAKVMLEHGRFMASKKDKKNYGNTPEVQAQAAGVTYIFNIPNQDPNALPDLSRVIDLKPEIATDVPEVTIALDFNIAGTPPPALLSTMAQIKAIPHEKQEEMSDIDRWNF